MATNVRILLTGGGTGGHIYPLVAVAQKLKGLDLRFFGNPGQFNDYLKKNNIRIHKIASSKLRRYFSPLNFLDFFKFFFGFFQAIWKLFWIMPDVAFSKGGPGTLAVVLACRWYRIPVILHESDIIPGLTNRIASRYAKKIFLSFSEAEPYFQRKKQKAEIIVSGQPVREEILYAGKAEEGKKYFGFNPGYPVILILGGSQGATKINEFILNNLEEIASKFQILHSVGSLNYKQYQKEYEFISKDMSPAILKNYRFVPNFEDDIKTAYDAADIVVSRTGASAIFETAARGKPAILVPLPNSANGHQMKNAEVYEATGAAVIIEEENLLKNIFTNEIAKILSDEPLRAKMSEAAKQFYKENAAQTIADNIIQIITLKK